MTSAVLFLGAVSPSIAAVHGDFNQGGESDPAVVERMANGNTRWHIFLKESGVKVTYDFPGLGDAMVMQRYGGRSLPGIVRVLSIGQPLQWQMYNPDGTIRTFFFGMPGDIVPNHGGQDFDNDGVSDCYVVRNVNNVLRWFITPNCDPVNRGFYSFDWGVASTDRPLVGDMQETDKASAIAVRRLGPNLQWWGRTKDGAAVSHIFANNDDIPLIPQAFHGNAQPNLAVARRTNTGMQIWFKKADGSYDFRPLGANDSIPLTGHSLQKGKGVYGAYIRAAGFGAIATVDSASDFFTLGGSDFWFVSPDGQVYPRGQGPTPVGGGSVGGSGGSDNGGSWCGGSVTLGGYNFSSSDCTEAVKNRDGSGGFKSNSQNSRGRLKIMLPTKYYRKLVKTGGFNTLYVCSSTGQQLDTCRQPAGEDEWGPRERCYSTKSLSALNFTNMTVVAPLQSGGAACVLLPSNRTID